eukprot:SAG22_NODE_857_length_6837_cov_22.929059_2_plen_92_part_00
MNQRDLLNRELGHKPKKTIGKNKSKGIKPGWRQRGNIVYPHRLPNNHLGNSGTQMNLVKAFGGAKRIIPPAELRLRTSLDRHPQPYRFKQG